MRQGWVNRSNAIHAIDQSANAGSSKIKRAMDRRRRGRLSVERVRCNLGSIINLSAGGMQLQRHRELQGEQQVVIFEQETQINLKAEVAWCRKVGFRKYLVGLQFIDVTPEITGQLGRLATANKTDPTSPI